MSRINFPIWQDADIHQTGHTLQHLVNGSWVNTGMKVMPMPEGYEPDARVNRFVENDLKSTKPDLSLDSGITAQPYAYQVYKFEDSTVELGFINDWSYEEWSGEQRCLSAPINRHADSRQKLVYGNFSETGNSIVIKEMIQPIIKMQPNSIAIGAEQYQTITIVVTSNTSFELILPEWLTASQTAFTSGTTVAYLYPQTNTSFDSRQFTIQAKHEGYWSPDYEYTNLAQVTQAGKVAYLTIYPDPLGVAWDTTGLTSVTVYTNTDFTATTNSSDTWLTYSGKTEVGTNYYNVYFNISANTGDNRQTHAYFEYVVNSSGGTYTRALRVVQAHAPITVIPQSVIIESVQSSITVTIISLTPWTATTENSWISIPSTGNSGETVIYANVEEYTGVTSRNGTCVFTNASDSTTFTVLQKGVGNKIIYKSTNSQTVAPLRSGVGIFGANIVSNTYYPDADYGEIIFDSAVTKVGYYAFDGRNTLSELIMPDTVTEIGESAINSCSNLTKLELSNNITSISAYYSIAALGALTSLTIPDSVTSITSMNIVRMGLTSFNLPANVAEIGANAIRCTGITALTVDAANTVFDSRDNCNAIINTSANTIVRACSTTVIPSTVTAIGQLAYMSCTSSVTIPENITSIGPSAFAHLSNLVSISLPNTITAIESSTFSTCTSLSSITIPNSVTSIDDEAFYGCTSLTSITIPDSVVSITGSPFTNCTSAQSISIGSGLTTIKSGTIVNGSNPFEGCSAVSSITVSSQNTTFSDRGCNGIFSTRTLLTGCYLTTIPNDIVTIGYDAFLGCTLLSSITIPDSVSYIRNNAFRGCRNLMDIYYNDTISQWNSITKGSDWKTNVPTGCVVHCTDGDTPI